MGDGRPPQRMDRPRRPTVGANQCVPMRNLRDVVPTSKVREHGRAINRFPNMRHTRVSSLLIAAALAAGGAAHAGDESFRLAVGRQMPITLQENPSTGYRWQVDTAASHNLSILRIEDKGFSPNGGGTTGRSSALPGFALEHRSTARGPGARQFRPSAALGGSGAAPDGCDNRSDGAVSLDPSGGFLMVPRGGIEAPTP